MNWITSILLTGAYGPFLTIPMHCGSYHFILLHNTPPLYKNNFDFRCGFHFEIVCRYISHYYCIFRPIETHVSCMHVNFEI
jgi:hypothetical protein